jgi:hypothetical protein
MFVVRCWLRGIILLYNYKKHSMLLVSRWSILADTTPGTECNVCWLWHVPNSHVCDNSTHQDGMRWVFAWFLYWVGMLDWVYKHRHVVYMWFWKIYKKLV